MNEACPKCGHSLNPDTGFCKNCGHGVINHRHRPNTKKIRQRLLSLCGVLLGGLIIAVFCLNMFGNTYQKPIELVEEIANGSYESIERIAPKEYWQTSAEKSRLNTEDFLKSTQKKLGDKFQKTTKPQLVEKYGENFQIAIKDIERYGIIEDDGLDLLRENLNNNYKINEKSVKSAILVRYTVKVTGSKSNATHLQKAVAVKIGNKWYLTNRVGSLGTAIITWRYLL